MHDRHNLRGICRRHRCPRKSARGRISFALDNACNDAVDGGTRSTGDNHTSSCADDLGLFDHIGFAAFGKSMMIIVVKVRVDLVDMVEMHGEVRDFAGPVVNDGRVAHYLRCSVVDRSASVK